MIGQSLMRGLLGACCLLLVTGSLSAAGDPASFVDVVRSVQPKIVKIYGAGGFRGLEAYQSGLLISPNGHVLTVWSYVLDTDFIGVTLDDGRRFDGKLVAADPRLEVAVLKIDAQGLPCFKLDEAVEADGLTRVLAFSNLYGVATGDEPSSVQHGVISVRSPLNARRGTYESPYHGPAYILDAMTNNPGAAGGALTDRQGRLLGLLGKELRNTQNNTWLNYAIPASALAKTVEEIVAGRYVRRPSQEDEGQPKPKQPWTLDLVGVQLVPDVLPRTPPYVDSIRGNTPAALMGLRSDDLLVFINDRLVPSCASVRNELQYIDRIDPVRLTVMRGQELVEVVLKSPSEASGK